jgi:hypothetical protein
MNDTHAAPATVPDTPFRTAILVAVFCSSTAALYAGLEIAPPPLVWLFFIWGPVVSVILWVQKDSARTGVGSVHDLDFLLWFLWPIALPSYLPWYGWKTRGRACWRLLVKLAVLVLSPYITYGMVSWLRSVWSL